MKVKYLTLLAAAALLGGWGTQALASEVEVERGSRPFTLGVGVIWKDQVYDDFEDSDKFRPVPLILWEGEKFFFRADTFGYKLIDSGPWEIAPILTFEGNGYQDDNSDTLDGMSDRDPWIGAGAHVVWQPEKFGLKVEGTGDIADESNGGRFEGQAFYTSRSGPWFWRGFGSVEWVSEGFNEYYYGVESDEVITGVRPAYSPSEGTNFHVGGTLGFTRDKWVMLGFAKYSFFDDEVDDSPITEDDQMLTLGVAIGYTFGGK